MPRRDRDDDDDDDDRPRRKRRRDDDDDDDDDRPRGRGRSQPKKGGSGLLLVLGIIGGVLLLCGGGIAAVWFGFLAPAAERVRKAAEARAEERRQEEMAGVTPAKLNQLRAGMTKAEVEAVMGPGRVAAQSDIFFVGARFPDQREFEQRWNPVTNQGRVYIWEHFLDRIIVAYSRDPSAGGTVVGIAGAIDTTRTYSEPARLSR